MKKSRLKLYNTIFWKFRKLHLMRIMEYRGDFYFWMAISSLWSFFNIFFFSIIVSINGDIGGWDINEMYLLLGVFTMIDAFTWSFFYHNMRNYTEIIYNGRLSGFLTKPIDAQFLLMTHSNSYNNISRFFIGLATFVFALQQLGISPSFIQIISFILLFVASLVIIYFLWFIIATMAFWVEKLDNINDIMPAIRRVWQLPRNIFTGALSFIFTIIFPLGLVSSIPAEIFLDDKFSQNWTIYFVLWAIAIVVISRIFFKISIKKYSGVGT